MPAMTITIHLNAATENISFADATRSTDLDSVTTISSSMLQPLVSGTPDLAPTTTIIPSVLLHTTTVSTYLVAKTGTPLLHDANKISELVAVNATKSAEKPPIHSKCPRSDDIPYQFSAAMVSI